MPRANKDFGYYSGKKYDGMMGRCYRTTDRSYKHYGELGVKVAAKWIKDINEFRAWLLAELERIGVSVEVFCATPGNYQLDRIDPNGHYTPQNCRIVNRQTNSRNQRHIRNKVVESAEGEEICFASSL